MTQLRLSTRVRALGRWTSTLLLALSLPLCASTHAEGLGINLSPGQSKTIELDDMAESVDLSRSDVVDVSRGTSKAEIVVKARSMGSVDLSIRLKNGKTTSYQITVSDPDALSKRLEHVRRLLGSLSGVTVAVQGSQIILAGRVTNRSIVQRIASVKAQYPGLVIDGTDKAMPEPNTIVQSINRILNENDIGNIQATAYGRLLVLEGSPKDDSERDLALRISGMIQPDIEDRISKLSNGAPPINIEVMFVEVENRNHKEFGFKGKDGGAKGQDNKDQLALGSVGADGIAGKTGRLNWTIGNLQAFLSMIQTKTSSRVLSNPQIIGRSGVQAEFHSGGIATFGVQSVQNGVAVTDFKEVPYGVGLKVLPILDKIGQIDVTIDAQVAEFAATPVKNAIVDTVETRLKTAVTLKDGQSIMLSGLVNRRNQKSVDKVPLLGDIPIIGELFKSRTINDQDKELLILITMNRISGNDQTGDDARRLFDKARKDIEFSIFD